VGAASLGEALKHNTSLRFLGLGGNQISDAGAASLGEVLKTNATLVELNLNSNQIGDAGACALARALADGAAVRRLSLHDNCIGDIGAMCLAEEIEDAVEELDLWGNQLTAAGKGAVDWMARCEVFLEVDPCPGTPVLVMSAASARMRAILFEWICQVHSGARAPLVADREADPQDVLFRAYGHVDAYTSCRAVGRAELQLAGIACTLLARGHSAHDHRAGDDQELAAWLAFVTDGTCTVDQVRNMLVEVQGVLGFSARKPTVYIFLRRFLRRTGWTEKSFSLANYLIELATMDAAFRAYRPQAVAAAALAHACPLLEPPCAVP